LQIIPNFQKKLFMLRERYDDNNANVNNEASPRRQQEGCSGQQDIPDWQYENMTIEDRGDTSGAYNLHVSAQGQAGGKGG
jgi:hypothetical protein